MPWRSLLLAGHRRLPITGDEGGDVVALRLRANSSGRGCKMLSRAGARHSRRWASRAVHVDLNALSFVSASGDALLASLHEAGFRLAGTGPATSHLLEPMQDGRIWGDN